MREGASEIGHGYVYYIHWDRQSEHGTVPADDWFYIFLCSASFSGAIYILGRSVFSLYNDRLV
jgi:hypothetical protein